MSSCREFRDHLELALQGLPQPERLTPLSWDQHLLGCQACRELLDAEQALELLLASLPEPALPPELVSRLLERLKRDRSTQALDLDALLDGAPAPVLPSALAARVLEGVRPERRRARDEAQLDRLLDSLPDPTIPVELPARVLASLRSERQPAPLSLLRSTRLWVPLAAAGVVAALWLSRSSRGTEPVPEQPAEIEIADTLELNDEMAEAFDVLENWDHLQGSDLDLLLASIDEVDELLIEASEWELEVEDVTDEETGG